LGNVFFDGLPLRIVEDAFEGWLAVTRGLFGSDVGLKASRDPVPPDFFEFVSTGVEVVGATEAERAVDGTVLLIDSVWCFLLRATTKPIARPNKALVITISLILVDLLATPRAWVAGSAADADARAPATD